MNTGLSNLVVPLCLLHHWVFVYPPRICLHHISILDTSGEEKGRLGFFTTTLGVYFLEIMRAVFFFCKEVIYRGKSLVIPLYLITLNAPLDLVLLFKCISPKVKPFVPGDLSFA